MDLVFPARRQISKPAHRWQLPIRKRKLAATVRFRYFLPTMEIEHLREALHKKPFEPFTIRLADGRSMLVQDPEFVALSPSLVVVIGRNGYGASNIDPFAIVSVAYEGEQAA